MEQGLLQDRDDEGAAVPTGRISRLLRFGGIASGIAGSVAAGGLRALAQGQRPDMSQLLLTRQYTAADRRAVASARGGAETGPDAVDGYRSCAAG